MMFTAPLRQRCGRRPKAGPEGHGPHQRHASPPASTVSRWRPGCHRQPYNRGGAGQQLGGVTRMPPKGAGPDIDTAEALAQMLDEPSRHRAACRHHLETVQGERYGYPSDPPRCRHARQHGALLIIDDIQAGIGHRRLLLLRRGRAARHHTMAEAAWPRLAVAALLVKPEYDGSDLPSTTGTFRVTTTPWSPHALEKFWADDSFLEKERSSYLESRLTRIVENVPGAVEGPRHVPGRLRAPANWPARSWPSAGGTASSRPPAPRPGGEDPAPLASTQTRSPAGSTSLSRR